VAFRQILATLSICDLLMIVSFLNISEVKLTGDKTLLGNQLNTFYFCYQKQFGLHYNYQCNKRSLRKRMKKYYYSLTHQRWETMFTYYSCFIVTCKCRFAIWKSRFLYLSNFLEPWLSISKNHIHVIYKNIRAMLG